MFNLRLCNAPTFRYSQLKFGHMHLCGMGYKQFSPHCCECNSFGCTAAIRCGNACHGPHSDSLYSGSEHSQFNSPRLVKREVDFPNPRRAVIGANQLWRVNDSSYYRELEVLQYLMWTLYQIGISEFNCRLDHNMGTSVVTHYHVVMPYGIGHYGQHWFSIRCQAITWTNADLLSARPLGTNFSEIGIKM